MIKDAKIAQYKKNNTKMYVDKSINLNQNCNINKMKSKIIYKYWIN